MLAFQQMAATGLSPSTHSVFVLAAGCQYGHASYRQLLACVRTTILRSHEITECYAQEIDPIAAPTSAPVAAVRDSLAGKLAHGQVSWCDAVEQLKRDAVARTLEATGGNRAEAARRLGMDHSSLHQMAYRLGVPTNR